VLETKKSDTVWSRSSASRLGVLSTLSATNGSRFSEAVKIKVAKPTGGLKHIGRYSMREAGMCQGEDNLITWETFSRIFMVRFETGVF
jgi:hypothetical protein